MNDEASTPRPALEPSPWWVRPDDGEVSPATLVWAALPFGANARVTAVRQMTGGLVSSVHLLSIEDASGRRHEVILRRWATSRGERAGEMILEEVRVLRALSSTGLPAPALIDFDATGQAAGGPPSLLMTRLPGEINLAPRDSKAWLGQMARTLARIHGTVPADALPSREPREARDGRIEAWMGRPAIWGAAFEATSTPPPVSSARGLVHGDFQHFNLLWTDDVLAGVVDWGSAHIGCPDVDVGHCRLNLAVLFSTDWAEQFRLAYEAEAGRKVEPWWDLAELLDYSPDWQSFIPIQVAGRIPVDTEGMTERVEELIALTLDRL